MTDFQRTWRTVSIQRRSIRLSDYDYTFTGMYFLTICTHDKKCLFGDFVDDKIRLNQIGHTVEFIWHEIPNHFPQTKLDAFVIMPDHIHGIVVIGRGTTCRAPMTTEQFGQPVSGSIPTIVRSFKSAATKHINKLRQTPGAKLWQRNYWEHIIRNDLELDSIRKYIHNNPAKCLDEYGMS
jgi:REP element-mobilizing transposase RayT